eukprot:TRINITY_DN1340_c0_g1_i2.p1 TRINITY_DN1340_c0_g1~~TRINITY_DN1340_c0_g1_i2.p1  ORF type:complete len:502 (-),score=73.97 TRINITY_DN1340_c0_g1_i2:300-1805(-)
MATSSLLPKETIKIFAQAVGVDELADDVAQQLAADVEYRLREITQEAIKFMRHSKREKLTTDDINSALRLRNIELLYGYNSRDPLRFAKVQATRDLFYVEDRELEIETIINECRLPSAPRQVTFKCHWLAIEGVQPDIPQNPPKPANKPGTQDDADAAAGDNAGPGTQSSLTRMTDDAEVKPAVRHVLTKEQQVFFEKICLAVLGADVNAFHAAINSLRTDKGLHQLMPYFCKFITEKVSDCTQKFSLKVLIAMMKMVEALLMNSEVHVDHYLHQLIPAILTCLVGKRLCENPAENHWELRDFAAGLISHICFKYGRIYATIQPRIIKTLVHAFLDFKKPLTTHYGAIVGLTRLGQYTRQLVLIPNMEYYCNLLLPATTSPNPVKRSEALMVYSSVLLAAGQFLFDSSRMYDQAERLFQQSRQIAEAASMVPTAKKRAVDASGPNGAEVIAAAADSTPRSLSPEELVPLGTNYPQLFGIFGEALFPFLTHRKDDLASALFV